MIRTCAEHMIEWYNFLKQTRHVDNIRMCRENIDILVATATVSDRIILATFTVLKVRIYADRSIPINMMCFVGNGKVVRLVKIGDKP